jgi:uncharacterized Zn-binding protein involved in type VI secretion
MPPAARAGDLTAHGTPLAPAKPPPGSLTVIIGKKPAWRAGLDVHVCPLANGPNAHVGGVAGPGSLTVLIEGAPAARMGETVVEAGGPNKITAGCESVLIGG